MISRYDVMQAMVFTIYIGLFCVTEPIRQSLWVMLVLVVISGILMVLEYKKTHQFISPLFFWYGFWMVIISVARVDFHIYEFHATWEQPLFITIVVNTITFFVFYKFGDYFVGTRDLCTISGNSSGMGYTKWANVLFEIGIVAYTLNVLYTGGIPQFSSNIDAFRRGFVETPFYSVVTICRCAYVIAPLAIKGEESRKKKTIALGIVYLLCEALSGWRTYVFQSVILFMSAFLITTDVSKHSERIKNQKLIGKVGTLALFFIGYVAVTRGQGKWDSLGQQIVYVIRIIYLYFAPSFLNLQQAINNIEPVGYFLYTTEALWGKFISPTNMPGYQNIDQTTGSFNVSTYLLQPQGDLGLMGTIIWTALIAFVAAVSFKKSERTMNLVPVTFLAISNIVIFNFHNGFFLRSTSVILWIVIALIVEKVKIKM